MTNPVRNIILYRHPNLHLTPHSYVDCDLVTTVDNQIGLQSILTRAGAYFDRTCCRPLWDGVIFLLRSAVRRSR